MIKKLLLSLLVLSSSILAFSQGLWSPRTSLPDTGRVQGISGFAIGNYGYAGLGQYSNTYFDDFWRFDVSTNSWTKMADFPGSARVEPASFVIGSKAYLVTGSVKDGGACVTECWQYDTITGVWTQKTNFPGSTRVYAVGFAIGSRGYVGTGADELHDFRKDFYAYDTAGNGTWTRVADFGGIARSADCGFATGGKGYVCFGQDSTIKYYTDMWEYDPVADSWTQKTNYPGPPIYSAIGFVIGTNIYVGSGDTAGFTFDPQFWKYNTLTDTWSEVASLPGIGRILGAAFSVRDSGYYGLGLSISSQYFNNLYKFYPDTSTGINELKINETNISVFPNPFINTCNVILPQEILFYNLKFELYNLEGLKQNLEILQSGKACIISRNNLPSGEYILSIRFNNQCANKKLIILN